MAEVAVEGAVVPKDATPETRPDLFGTRGQLRPDGDGGMLSYMAADKAEYATPGDSQINSGFYVKDRGLPWHVALSRDLGEVELMQGVDGLQRALAAVQAAGGDYEVELVPVTPYDSDIVVPGKFVARRTDTGAPLGIVGRAFKVFQNRTLAEFCDLIVDSGEGKYETGGTMRNGADFFLSMELNHLEISVPGDTGSLKWYLLLNNSHDGTRPASWYITQVREVCRNTENLAIAGAITQWRLRHSGNLEGKVEQARAALGIAFRNQELVSTLTGKLATTSLLDRQVKEIFEKVVWPVASSAGDAEVERQSRNSEKAFENYLASPTLDDIRGTAWGAYNGVTEYLDHEVVYKGKNVDSTDLRAANLLFWTGAETKRRALTALVKTTR